MNLVEEVKRHLSGCILKDNESKLIVLVVLLKALNNGRAPDDIYEEVVEYLVRGLGPIVNRNANNMGSSISLRLTMKVGLLLYKHQIYSESDYNDIRNYLFSLFPEEINKDEVIAKFGLKYLLEIPLPVKQEYWKKFVDNIDSQIKEYFTFQL